MTEIYVPIGLMLATYFVGILHGWQAGYDQAKNDLKKALEERQR